MLYNAVCPRCGKANRDLYLNETGGYMECEYCHKTVYVARVSEAVRESAIDDKIQVSKGGVDINGAI